MLQLAEAEAELDAMTKDRDELQGIVDELEEKVICLADRSVQLWCMWPPGQFGAGITLGWFTHTPSRYS